MPITLTGINIDVSLWSVDPLPPALVGTPYSEQIVVNGGSGNYSFATPVALPGNWLLSATGVLSNTNPQQALSAQIDVTDNGV